MHLKPYWVNPDQTGTGAKRVHCGMHFAFGSVRTVGACAFAYGVSGGLKAFFRC